MFSTTSNFSDERLILLSQPRLSDTGAFGRQIYSNIPNDAAEPPMTNATAREQSPRFPWSNEPSPLASELWS